ncbi:MAG: IPT/TIG domain-containing protein [Acidobacteriia bacterium]|nr:IPT/TIG domain-containing protein [Terriglobia bacterium]
MVFTRSGGVWTQQGSKLVGTGAVGPTVNQGVSVALSADGNTAIVGGHGDNGEIGAAWVYTRSGGVWTQQGDKLRPAGYVGQPVYFGVSVALAADGNTAIVGGSYDNGGVGAAWIFARSSGVWTQQGSKLVGTGAVGPTVNQGRSVALAADGNTAIVGGDGDNGNGNAGAAWMFTRSGGVWIQQGSKLVGTGAVGPTVHQGTSVALSADGNTAIVGGFGDNPPPGSPTSFGFGAAWVFTRSGGGWTQQGSKLVGTGAAGPSVLQGESVALSADGNTAIVGGDGDNGNAGAAWMFTRSGGVWTQQGSKLVGSGAVGSARQGGSVALSADGNTAIVGGAGDNSFIGAAWVFVNSTAPSIASSGVVNGASFMPGIVPNSWITIQGTNLAPPTDTWDKANVNGALPTTLDGVSVSVGGKPAYVYFVSPNQINAVAPDVGTGTMSVSVTNGNITSVAATSTSVSVQPAFFLWAGKYPVATRQDFSYAVKNGTFTGLTTTPAKPGDVIILWGTGFGPTNPVAPVGVQLPADKTYLTAAPVTVTVGGIAAQVFGAALAPGFAALYQVAIQIPASAPDGDLLVVATINGSQSPASTVITVQH